MTTRLKLKTGDTVKVLRGKNAGKTGTVSQILPKDSAVVVDGVNTTIRHLKSQKRGEKGQRLEFFAPVPASNLALMCPKCQKPTRVGYHIAKGEDGNIAKSRQCKKCKETF